MGASLRTSPAMTLQDCILPHLGELSPQLRRAANFVLEHPEDIATLSLRRIATRSELAAPTFSRLARAVGCDTYEDLRDICRQDLKRQKVSFAESVSNLQNFDAGAQTGRGKFVVSQASSAVRAIQHLLETVDTERLAAAADTLVGARRVVLIGNLSASAFVDYLGYMADMVFDNWVRAGRGGTPIANALTDLDSRDAVIVVSFDHYARASIEAARLSYERGAHVISITDGVYSPLLPVSSSVFLVETESPQFFPSHVAPLVLLEAIVGMAVRRSGKKARDRIARVERSNELLGVYWQQRDSRRATANRKSSRKGKSYEDEPVGRSDRSGGKHASRRRGGKRANMHQ